MPRENTHPSSTIGRSSQRGIVGANVLVGYSHGAVSTGHEASDADIVGDLLDVAWFNQCQLAVLIPLVSAVQSTEETVDEVIGTAERFGTGDSASIGAAATLVAVATSGDEETIASCLSTMLSSFSDEELSDGAGALTAALTVAIAQVLGIDPAAAQAELIDAVLVHSGPDDGGLAAPMARIRRHLWSHLAGPDRPCTARPRRPTSRSKRHGLGDA